MIIFFIVSLFFIQNIYSGFFRDSLKLITNGNISLSKCPRKIKIKALYVEDAYCVKSIRALIIAPGQKFIVEIEVECELEIEVSKCKANKSTIQFEFGDSGVVQDKDATEHGNRLKFHFRLGEAGPKEGREINITFKKNCLGLTGAPAKTFDEDLKGIAADLATEQSEIVCTGASKTLKVNDPVTCEIHCVGYPIKSSDGSLARNKLKSGITCNSAQFKVEIYDLRTKQTIGNGDEKIARIESVPLADEKNLVYTVKAGSEVGAKWMVVARLSGKGVNNGATSTIRGSSERNIMFENIASSAVDDNSLPFILFIVFILAIILIGIFYCLSK